jgi:hypothetical protein
MSRACGETERSLAILDPFSGQIVETTTYRFEILTCGIEPTEQIVVHMTSPADADWAFVTVPMRGATVATTVSLLPDTTHELEVRSRDGSIVSPPVTVTHMTPPM